MDCSIDSSSNQARVQWVVRTLAATYCLAQPEFRRPPLDELVLTILSQSTTDANCERAFARLRETFPRWEDVRSAPVAAIAEAIKSGGLARQKAPRIQHIVGQVLDHKLLDDIETVPLVEAKARLTALPGVGPKTSACVLLFSCGRPALPVDTHVHRVSLRLGLIPAGTSAERAHDLLEALVPPDDIYAFHVGLIRHGRAICVARTPRCEQCILASRCQFYYDQRNGPGRTETRENG